MKYFNKICLFFSFILMLFSQSSFSDDLTVKLDPTYPVKGQSFNLIFEIETNSNAQASISFDPGRLEVLGRETGGIQTTTTYINGKLSTSRTMSYVYEIVAPEMGTYPIRNIKVDLDGQILTHKDLRVQALSRPKKKKDFFVEAVADKTKAYRGEAILVNYYFYYRLPSTEIEIVEFPKLDGFLKSYAQVSNISATTSDTVEVDGAIYRRQHIYKAKLFGEKVKTLRLDPLKIKVRYSNSRAFGPFSGFGLSSGSLRTMNIQSQAVEIEILPLPAENVPPYFSGLVGKHSFDLSIVKNKYLVNEAIEAKLTIVGDGALEKLSPLKIYNHPELEEFETDFDLEVNQNGPSRKVLRYTYLGRRPMEISDQILKTAYFDTHSKSYVTVDINVPGISISGVGNSSVGGSQGTFDKKNELPSTQMESNRAVPIGSEIVGPVYSYHSIAENWPRKLVYIFLAAWLISLAIIFLPKIRKEKSQLLQIFNDIQSKGIDYSKFFKLIEELRAKDRLSADLTTIEVIDCSSLTDEAKSYFREILIKIEEKGFRLSSKKAEGLIFKKKFFNELKRRIA